MDNLSNLLLWGVETDEEVSEIIRNYDDLVESGEIKPLELNPDNPYLKPRDQWTKEMMDDFENFKKNNV